MNFRRKSSVAATELPAGEPSRHDAIDIQDEARLAALGYKQDLNRDWGLLQNFGVSFSIISIVTGITTLFTYGLNTGGPGVMSCGWVVVSFFTFFVAMSMAEIVSSIPSAGGPYFWAAMLAPPRWSPLISWVTGWFNFVGQFAVTTGISFGLAQLISTTATIKNDYTPTAGKTLAIYIAILMSHGILNSFGVHLLKYLNNTSIILHSLGVGSLAIAILAKAPTHQTAKQVFATFYDGTSVPDSGAVGWSVRASPAYVAVIGILIAQFTITGFDASAHLSEETRDAARAAPWGVVISIGVSFIFGWFWMLSLLFSMQGLQPTINSKYQQPVVQIMVDAFGETGAVIGMTLVMICIWHCGLFSLTSNSRMMFAFSRDRALPGWFDYVHPKFQSPLRTIWLAAFLAFVLSLPSLGSTVAYSAATSIATIGLYISYVLPIATMLIWPSHFERGPWHLGKASKPVGIVAVGWVIFITIVFCLPTQNPVTSQSLNYTPVAVGIVCFFVFGSWILWARRWFTGPIRQIEMERAGVDISDPVAVKEAEQQRDLDVEQDMKKL